MDDEKGSNVNENGATGKAEGDNKAQATGKAEDEKKTLTLRDATSMLKAEALRRYRKRHRSSFDRHEKAIDAELAANQGQKKSSRSPGPTTPGIQEEGEERQEDDVFEAGLSEEEGSDEMIDSRGEEELEKMSKRALERMAQGMGWKDEAEEAKEQERHGPSSEDGLTGVSASDCQQQTEDGRQSMESQQKPDRHGRQSNSMGEQTHLSRGDSRELSDQGSREQTPTGKRLEPGQDDEDMQDKDNNSLAGSGSEADQTERMGNKDCTQDDAGTEGSDDNDTGAMTPGSAKVPDKERRSKSSEPEDSIARSGNLSRDGGQDMFPDEETGEKDGRSASATSAGVASSDRGSVTSIGKDGKVTPGSESQVTDSTAKQGLTETSKGRDRVKKEGVEQQGGRGRRRGSSEALLNLLMQSGASSDSEEAAAETEVTPPTDMEQTQEQSQEGLATEQEEAPPTEQAPAVTEPPITEAPSNENTEQAEAPPTEQSAAVTEPPITEAPSNENTEQAEAPPTEQAPAVTEPPITEAPATEQPEAVPPEETEKVTEAAGEQQAAVDQSETVPKAEGAEQQAVDGQVSQEGGQQEEAKPAEQESQETVSSEQTGQQAQTQDAQQQGATEQQQGSTTEQQQGATEQQQGATEQQQGSTTEQQQGATEQQQGATEQQQGATEQQQGATEETQQAAQREGPVDGTDPQTRGDEDEVQSEEITGNEEEEKIPDDFFYNFDEHVSRPQITEESGLPGDMLKLHHSFGYDCQKRANLHMLDNETTVFAAGNLIEILDIKTQEQKYLRSTSGGGIGAIAVHPSKKYFAVAEKGSAPNINVFEYPSLKLFRILRGGTQASYSFVDFSPDGRLLASVGGEPDFMLTLWDWRQEKTVLRSKAFSQDVFRVTFSTELEGQLTSSGTGHIRFWKMAKTFTGLKLQGALGKFGKTEISDIEGYVELPDGKVLSGSEWGNLLLWDGGLIKVEISRKNKKSCHHGIIQQIIMDEGELMTVGTDGYIRVWDFETIDTADVTDESSVFEMEPMNELKVGTGVSLRSIVKSADPEEPTIWYAQDANGAIWRLDLSFSFTSQEPEKLAKFHSGEIRGLAASPASHLVATTGNDHFVFVYDYLSRSQLCRSRFNAPGTSLMWAPQIVDPKGGTILVGFEDGVVRVLVFQKKEVVDVHGRKKEDQSELLLKQAFKPHNKSVTCLVVDSKGELLATGSDDNTVFFFNIGDSYEPIGFIKTPSPVTHLDFSPASEVKNKLLVSCTAGEVLEVNVPEPGKFDTSHTFEITGLSMRNHKFKSIKSHLRHEEELEKKRLEEIERKKREAEERRKRIERGLETESEQGDEPEEEKAPEEEWQPFLPEEPSPVLFATRSQEKDRIWLSMGAFDAGYLYECEFMDSIKKEVIPENEWYQPTRTVPVKNSNDVPISCIKFSRSGQYMVMGMQDGSVRIQPVVDNDLGNDAPYWVLSSHDNTYGRITHIDVSHDGKYVFSVGGDGNFFVYEFMEEAKIEEEVKQAKAKIPSARKELADKTVTDIEDPSAYSIEDAKQKAEHDKMVKLAEQKKATVRKTVKGMREQFRRLIEKNNTLPTHLRLDRKEFEMDPEIKRQLAQHTEEKIESVKKEMAWEEEKHRIALSKLRMRFKEVVECERIVVKSFQSPHEVSSFRASKLPDDFYQAKAGLDKRRTTMYSKDGDTLSQPSSELLLGVDPESKQHTAELLTGLGRDEGGEGLEKEDTQTRVTTTLKGSMGERITKALLKVEDKKKKRAARRAQWAELNSSKPDDTWEDPADVAAIKDAQENMGDYKLKSADDYVVPDHLRMNTDKARARLLLLKDLLHKHKYDFNQRLLSLRDKKLTLISNIKELVFELDEVKVKLPVQLHKPSPPIPRMHPDELPEKKYEYTRETLLKFKVELEDDKKKKKPQASDGFGGGMAANMAKADTFTPSPVPGHKGRREAAELEEKMMEFTPYAAESRLTELEERMNQAEQIRLEYQQDFLINKIATLIKNFDAELRCLRHNKFKLDVDLKNADLRHVTLFEEFLLLRDFEKHENVIVAKLEGKQQEKFDMQDRIVQVQARIESKKKELEKLQEKEKALYTTFQASLGDNNKFQDYLTKVFKKKIKRAKKKATEDEDEDSEDEDSDDESDWEESEEESDSETGAWDLDICPPGCDQNIYDNTCALREKRLDLEEASAEVKKDKESLNKEHDSFNKKARVIDASVRQAEGELEAFQLEKQRKLNELDVVVQLKLHQIQHTTNNCLPQDLSQCLVFEQAGAIRLTHRIKELEHEKGVQRKEKRDAKRKHVQLIKDRKVFDSKIGEMQDTCDKMMIQKFGRIVDLEKLETVTVNRQVEELKERLRVAEITCSNEVTRWDEKIRGAKDEITELVKENTNKLDQLNMLLEEKKDYEKQLDSRQKNLGDEYGGVRKSDVHERRRLIQLVHLQAQEIEALKEEITLLSRKGGHILPPAQPPMPQSAQQQTRPSGPGT